MSSDRQLAAIMFADIVGYTALMQKDEQHAIRLITRFKDELHRIAAEKNGRIVQYFGDGCLLTFESSSDAVECAMALQKVLKEEPQVPLRIGLHLGDVVFRNENIFGDGVNIASRIESMGIPGVVLLSKSIRDQVKNKTEYQLTALGTFHFKNVDEPIEVFAIANPGFIVPKVEELQGKLKEKTKLNRKLIAALSVLLLVVASYLVYQYFFTNRETEAISKKSIAVLPFVNMSDDEDQEYFSDGMMEEILNQLARISDLKVSSRTSSMLFRDSKKPLREIAKTLRVANILEGSVRKSNDKIRITVQLIDAETDKHLWSETFDREITDVFSIQTDIATQIAKTLEAKLSPEEQQHIAKRHTENTEAYQLYLKGRYYWNQRKSESFALGIENFKKAIAVDSLYALAYAGLGDSYLMLGVYGILPPFQSMPLAKEYTQKALELDPALGEAYATLCDINIHYDWDAAAAENNFKKAIQYNPNYSNAYHWHSEVQILRKQFDRAIEESKTGLKLDPYSLIINTQLGANYIYAGEFEKAIDQLNTSLGFDSLYTVTHLYLGIAYIGNKQYEKALGHLQKADKINPGNSRILSTLGFAEAMAGKKDAALKIEQQLLKMAEEKYVPSFDLATIETGLGKKEKAISFLQKEFEEKGPWMPFLEMIPTFQSLHDHKTFASIVSKVTN